MTTEKLLADALRKLMNSEFCDDNRESPEMDQARSALAAPSGGAMDATLQIDLLQAQLLVGFFGGDNADVTIGYKNGHLWAYCTEYPEEGAVELGKFDPDKAPMQIHELWCGEEPRFFVEHGMIHDRLTGKHVTTDEDSWTTPEGKTMPNPHGSGISSTCALLNNMAIAALPTQPPAATEDARDGEWKVIRFPDPPFPNDLIVVTNKAGDHFQIVRGDQPVIWDYFAAIASERGKK